VKGRLDFSVYGNLISFIYWCFFKIKNTILLVFEKIKEKKAKAVFSGGG